jgi:hypothetical protein
MTALIQAISRLSLAREIEDETLKLIAMFCVAGLLISIILGTYRLDLSPGFFRPTDASLR